MSEADAVMVEQPPLSRPIELWQVGVPTKAYANAGYAQTRRKWAIRNISLESKYDSTALKPIENVDTTRKSVSGRAYAKAIATSAASFDKHKLCHKETV